MGCLTPPPPSEKISSYLRASLCRTGDNTEGQTVPNMPQRLQEKAFENKKNLRGGHPRPPYSDIYLCQVLTPPPPPSVKS